MTATGIQVFSFLFICALLLGIVFSLVLSKGPFAGYFTGKDVSIERKKLEDQYQRIQSLEKRIAQQDQYADRLRMILLGEEDQEEDTLKPNGPPLDPSTLPTDRSDQEKHLAQKVKADLRTGGKKTSGKSMHYFVPPVKGEVIRSFDPADHQGVDIATGKTRTIVACLSGTVIFSGFTQRDGAVLVIDHANGFVSVYKENRIILKREGERVQINDPIALVENGSEKRKGQVHFELWYNQQAVDPQDYISISDQSRMP